MPALLLNRSQTAAALDPVTLLPLVRHALRAIADGTASAPARIAAFSEYGLLGAMPGYVPGLGLAGKLTTVFSRPGSGSVHRGIVLLADPVDGRPLALLDAEAVTALRTAACATVAMLALAPPEPSLIAVIGSGAQGRAQLRMLDAIGCRAHVRVVSRRPDRATQAARLLPTAVAVGSVLDSEGDAGDRRRGGAQQGVTVFKSTGHAALDVAGAVAAYRRATELGIGASIDL